MVTGDVRRSRLRLLKVAGGQGGPFEPPLLSLSPHHLRRIDAMDQATVTPLGGAREELWVRGEQVRLRGTIDDAGKLDLIVDRDGAEPARLRLIRIPTGREATGGAARYFGRWEHGKNRAVITPKGAGVILPPDSITIERPVELVDVYQGATALLAIRNVPNGARVVCADGVDGLEVDALLSDVLVPPLERGPDVAIHPREAFLRGFPAVGFRASFAGLDFDGFAPTQGDRSAELARFTKKQRGVAYGALRPVEPPEDEDALLAATLDAELSPSADTGRVKRGKPGTITLTDGRRYRVHSGVRERLPQGSWELIACALLDAALVVRVCVPFDELSEPNANVVLDRLGPFLLGIHVVRQG